MKYRVWIFNFLFLLSLITLPYKISWSADPPLPTPVGRVIWVSGTFKATMPNNEVRILQKTSVIYLHDTLTTGTGSQAQIAFTDNTLMTFRADSKFVVDQYSFTPQSKKGASVGKYIMTILEGGFRTITGLIAKNNPNDYIMNTPVATIGVRGTDYSVYVRNGQLNIGFKEGKPCVKSNGQELCLDKSTPYVQVPNPGAAPVGLTVQPPVLKEVLDVISAKVEPFNVPGPAGSVTSFCIQ